MENIWGQFYMPKGGNLDESIMFSFNAADRRLFFSAIHSLVDFFYGASFLHSYFTSPHVPLGVMLDAHPYVEICASSYIP